MGWNAQDIEKLRKQNNGQKSTAGTGQSAGKSNKNPTSGSLSAQVLGQMTGTQSVQTTKKAESKLPTVERTGQPEWLGTGKNSAPAAKVLGTGTKSGKTYAERNNAMPMQSASGAMASAPTAETSTEKREYTDAELLAKGYSRKQIHEARQYIADFDALPDWQRAARRTSNTIGGIVDTVASAPLMAGETAVRSVQNAVETGKNWNELQESVKSDNRQWKLLCLMTGGKTQYAGRDNAMQPNGSGVMAAPAQSTGTAYTDEELKAKGYSQSEIDRMRARISGAKVSEGIDPEKSLGYQMYKRGQQLNEAAQAGMSPLARQLMGVTTSAAENLAVAGISPALVLPVLSAQGGAESMGQSIEKGESAGKTLAGGLAKFGAGWAINSVGAADLARTMGSDYAKDTLAGKLADMVRSVADNGVLAQQYPTVANAVSGGIDNAMQAFVETYADKAIDAALGDAQAAEEMFSRDTFLQALESGLSGGASGALGGAVGTQLGRMSAALETAGGQTVQRNEPSPSAQGADSSRSEERRVGKECRSRWSPYQ